MEDKDLRVWGVGCRVIRKRQKKRQKKTEVFDTDLHGFLRIYEKRWRRSKEQGVKAEA